MSRLVPGMWLAIGLAVWLGAGTACDPGPEAEARLLCTTICRCVEVPLPGKQDECVAECTADSDFRNVPEPCSQCIFAHADRCGSLMADCAPVCIQNDPDPPPPEFPDAAIRGAD